MSLGATIVRGPASARTERAPPPPPPSAACRRTRGSGSSTTGCCAPRSTTSGSSSRGRSRFEFAIFSASQKFGSIPGKWPRILGNFSDSGIPVTSRRIMRRRYCGFAPNGASLFLGDIISRSWGLAHTVSFLRHRK